MNNRERTIIIFNRKIPDRLVWQPRLHHWYYVNKARGTLPKKYEGYDLLEIYDDLGASPRAYHYFNDTIRCVEGEGVELHRMEDRDYIYTKYVTPKGKLIQVERKTEYGVASMRVEYFLKSTDDFEILAYILRRQRFEFDKELYLEREKLLGDRSEPIINVPWGSIQRLFIAYMGFERGLIALWRHKEKVEWLLQVFDENDDERFKIIKRAPFKIVNFGDNIDENLCSPSLFKKYMLPYYQRRTKELHEVGKFCTSHWDGKVKHLLPLAKETGLDGLECVPPEPQGNVTLKELREELKLNGMILVDGIPAIYFLPIFDVNRLKSFVYDLLDLFAPNIIVGISDMLPPDGDIERVRLVGEIVANYIPNAYKL
ncbi:MAG: hypothetical protein QXS10_06995 [Candidatus Bathyarchaeia archaeon]|nr:hypothetical protein [Candidatus Bathyarchaeota archaeon]